MAPALLTEADSSRIAALASTCPLLPEPIAPLRRAGYGFQSFVFETASRWILRVARTPEAAVRHAFEVAALPAVAKHLTVAVPCPVLVSGPAPCAPFGVIGYRALPGRVMEPAGLASNDSANIAADLGQALATLHAVPRESLPGLPVTELGHFQRLRAATEVPLRERLTPPEAARLSAWWDAFLSSEVLTGPAWAVTHGDPWWENLLVDEGRLTGILDWEFLSWRDPANDLGVTLSMGEEFFSATLEAYRQAGGHRDTTFERRARLLAAVREFYGVRYAVERADELEWRDCLAALRAGPILTGAAP